MKNLCVFILSIIVSGTAQSYVIGPTIPGKWGDPTMGSGATITWSLIETGTFCSAEAECTINNTFTSFFDFMPTGFEQELENAFNAWNDVANLAFTQVDDGGEAFNTDGSSGDIRLGGHYFDGESGTIAHGFFPPYNWGSAAGDTHFDVAENWTIGFSDDGFDIFQVFTHEIGHALGLDHSYVANSLMNPYYSEEFLGLQSDDIAGIQYIYGEAINDIVIEQIPEPNTLLLLGIALLGGFFKRFMKV